MSVTVNVSEKFEDLMNSVPSESVYAPAAITECRQAQIKRGPLAEARKEIAEKTQAKKDAKESAKKNLRESAEQVSDLYSKYVLEGVLDSAKDYNPESAEKVEKLKVALAEAALCAKDLLV